MGAICLVVECQLAGDWEEGRYDVLSLSTLRTYLKGTDHDLSLCISSTFGQQTFDTRDHILALLGMTEGRVRSQFANLNYTNTPK